MRVPCMPGRVRTDVQGKLMQQGGVCGQACERQDAAPPCAAQQLEPCQGSIAAGDDQGEREWLREGPAAFLRRAADRDGPSAFVVSVPPPPRAHAEVPTLRGAPAWCGMPARQRIAHVPKAEHQPRGPFLSEVLRGVCWLG
jgi:hypothetical protein